MRSLSTSSRCSTKGRPSGGAGRRRCSARAVALTAAGAAVAASALVVAGLAAWHNWRLSWQPERAWAIASGGALAVGHPLEVAAAPATIDIARLGEMQAAPGTALDLTETGRTHHRFTMSRGMIDVRLWAPPGRVVVHTPAGDVIDLGCIFSLVVNDAGTANLSVRTGWVELENAFGSRAIPAGASAGMAADREPQVPVYDDASAAFRGAVRVVEMVGTDGGSTDLTVIAREARARDVITLLMLSDVSGIGTETRRGLMAIAARFSTPPSADAIDRIVGGDRDLFWRWYDSLPLPRMKNWWANWRDAFPR